MTNSLIQGKTWYWRRGIKQMPLHSDAIIRTSELCLPIPDILEGNRILKELKDHGIIVDMKNTHSSSPYIPTDTLVLYAAIHQDGKIQQEEDNLKKLENYIISNDGRIGNDQPKSRQPLFQGLFGKLFGRGGK